LKVGRPLTANFIPRAGRDQLDFETWMGMDVQYIDNWSLGLGLANPAADHPASADRQRSEVNKDRADIDCRPSLTVL
jgi:hypothetical protein